MSQIDVEFIGIDELIAAIKRNPQLVIDETRKYLIRGIAEYERGIKNNPWRIGGSGGGVPTKSGHLSDSHGKTFEQFQASIGADRNYSTGYSKFVHKGTVKMQPRPWLDWVKEQSESNIAALYRELLKNITADLAR